MDYVSYVLLLISAVFGVTTLAVGLFGRNREVPAWEFLFAGIFLYRDVKKYIKARFIAPFMVFSYITVASFGAFVFYTLLKYLLLQRP